MLQRRWLVCFLKRLITVKEPGFSGMHCNSGSSFGEGRIINTPISLFKGINFKKAPGPGTEPTVCPVRPQLPFPSVP